MNVAKLIISTPGRAAPQCWRSNDNIVGQLNKEQMTNIENNFYTVEYLSYQTLELLHIDHNNTNRSSNNNENAPNANAPSKTQQKKISLFLYF